MEEFIVTIESIKPVTHDVKCFRFEKPANYHFVPGQATDVSVNKPGWENEKRPFTFTSLNNEPWLEFTIKRYADHQGVTNLLHELKEGDQLIIRDVWGAIEYKGAGYFIAGGAGITPFISILRQLKKDDNVKGNVLFFSNKTSRDIIYEDELRNILDDNVHFILTRETNQNYIHAHINREFLLQQNLDISKHFYVCGPDEMVQDITKLLSDIGAATDSIVFEK